MKTKECSSLMKGDHVVFRHYPDHLNRESVMYNEGGVVFVKKKTILVSPSIGNGMYTILYKDMVAVQNNKGEYLNNFPGIKLTGKWILLKAK